MARMGRSSTDSAVFSAANASSRLNVSKLSHCVAVTNTAASNPPPKSGHRQLQGSANPTASAKVQTPPIHTLRVRLQAMPARNRGINNSSSSCPRRLSRGHHSSELPKQIESKMPLAIGFNKGPRPRPTNSAPGSAAVVAMYLGIRATIA